MKRKLIFGLILVLVIGAVGFALNLVGNPSQPVSKFLQAAKADTAVSINDRGGYIEIIPNTLQTAATKGIIFYPGGLVTAESYIYPWTQVSKLTNVPVYIAKMPLNLAILNVNAADKIIADNPQIKSWIMSGHSLGGAMLSEYLKAGRNLPKIKALIFQAAFPNDDFLKTNSNLQILSLIGTKDGKITTLKSKEEAKKLPTQAIQTEITGMNHAQFGAYGKQSGDLSASISNEDAWAEWTTIVAKFIDMIK